MNRSMLRIAALSASLITAGTLAAQSGSAPVKVPQVAAPAEKPQKLVKMVTLNDAVANREFQANVQIVQAQRQAVVELNSALEKETDPAKKKDLKTKVDAALAKLNENNDLMRKTYGFSITRNYTMEIEKASVYMFVTEEEAAQIEKDQAAQAKQPAKK